MKFLMFAHETDRITRFLYCLRHSNFHVMERFGLSCHVLSGHNTLKSVHGAACFLEMECHVLPRHVMPCQITAQSLCARRRHSSYDLMWWRSAIKAGARGERDVWTRFRSTRTIPQSLKSLLWRLDFVWMGYPLSISGTL